jgi:hypothetical protein
VEAKPAVRLRCRTRLNGIIEALAGLATNIEYREFPDESSWWATYRVAT